MSSFNKIIIVGYLGRNPELRYTPEGKAVCNMSVATSEKRKNSVGESEDHTTWFRVTVWGRQAELANEYLTKGRQVYIEGRFRLAEFTDREGQTRFSAEVSATDIQFLGRSGDSAQHASANAGVRAQPEEAEVVTTPTPARSSKKGSSKRGTKPTVNVEDEELVEGSEIPF